eukprot:4579556-Pyramimonas_sp.AAC.1
MQDFHGWRAVRFQHVVLALAPRTFLSKSARSSRIPMVNIPAIVFWHDSGSTIWRVYANIVDDSW